MNSDKSNISKEQWAKEVRILYEQLALAADVEKKLDIGLFQKKLDGSKNWELRIEDDHKYKPGEIVKYREWCPIRKIYTGRFLVARVDEVIRMRPMISEGSCLIIDHTITSGGYVL